MKKVLRWLGLMPGSRVPKWPCYYLCLQTGVQPEIQPHRLVDEYSKQKLGASSTHHIQCRCRSSRGDEIIPHG